MPKRKSQEEFLKQIKDVHGDKFDYSKVVYVNTETKVELKCNKCGKIFYATPHNLLKGSGCPYCAGVARSNTDEFIKKVREIHGYRYDYSLVDYQNATKKVKIICDKHGIFEMSPRAHYCGEGCPKCALEESKSPICGIGINDYEGQVKKNCVHLKSYALWRAMIDRCYNNITLKKHKSYMGCSVCDEWKYFSNFKKWYDKNAPKEIDGYSLDKDLITHGNRVYSPDTCCFLPIELNSMLITQKRHRGNYKIGVFWNKRLNKYIAQVNYRGKSRKHIGVFDTEEEAFLAYKREKEHIIKTLADEYYEKGLITERVRDAMYNYKVMEDD